MRSWTGSGEITGNFTFQTANDLAVLLRAGALPAPLRVIEQRTTGPELGADQINAGKYSTLAGLALVAVFMVLRYGLFGFFADVALTLNVILLMALLTLLGATLTLPGIAGIVLTMGMAVDANVLIYERIREENRNGRSIIASIDQGFRRAMATIYRRQHDPSDRLGHPLPAGHGPRPGLCRGARPRHHHLVLHGGHGDPADGVHLVPGGPAEAARSLEKAADFAGK